MWQAQADGPRWTCPATGSSRTRTAPCAASVSPTLQDGGPLGDLYRSVVDGQGYHSVFLPPLKLPKPKWSHRRQRLLWTRPQLIGAYGRDGRPRPGDADAKEFRIPCDYVIVAIGQAIEAQAFEKVGVTTRRGAIQADHTSSVPGVDNVFAFLMGLLLGHPLHHQREVPLAAGMGMAFQIHPEVEGERAMVTACNSPVREGMVVHTNSPRARRTRRTNVELISRCSGTAPCRRSGRTAYT